MLVSCVIERAGDFLYETPPRALNLKEKWRRWSFLQEMTPFVLEGR
jgi:hypothetical protein